LGTNPRAVAANEEFDAYQNDPEVLDRFERLRKARLQLASDRQLPPYCICHDSTLKLIAVRAPESLEALERIKGMGPAKVRMYGEPLLRAVSSSSSQPSPRDLAPDPFD
jgi:ATP-dependent DNA helicase RecQ